MTRSSARAAVDAGPAWTKAARAGSGPALCGSPGALLRTAATPNPRARLPGPRDLPATPTATWLRARGQPLGFRPRCCKCPQVTSLLAHCGQALGTGASGGSAGMAQGVLVPDLHIQATKPWGTQEAGARRCSCERLRGRTASQVILAACGHCSANSQRAQAACGASRVTPRSAVQGEAAGMAPGGTCSQP